MSQLEALILPLPVAFLIGWLGGIHCIGMCGGIVSVLSVGLPKRRRSLFSLTYNLGRCLAYVLLGFIAGFLGLTTVYFFGIGQKILFILTNFLMIAFGLYLMDQPFLIKPIEKMGEHLWRYIEPLARQFFPVRSPIQALIVGFFWGFLPCGLVYSALATAIAAADPIAGALWMASFAFGSLPNLLLISWVGNRFLTRLYRSSFRWFVGLLITVWGVYGMFQIIPHPTSIISNTATHAAKN